MEKPRGGKGERLSWRGGPRKLRNPREREDGKRGQRPTGFPEEDVFQWCPSVGQVLHEGLGIQGRGGVAGRNLMKGVSLSTRWARHACPGEPKGPRGGRGGLRGNTGGTAWPEREGDLEGKGNLCSKSGD